MKSTGFPPWIDPGNAFKIVVKVEKYNANIDCGTIEMSPVEHEIWVDSRNTYSLDQFVEDMAAKIIWGRSQTLLVWGMDIDSGGEWRLTSNDQFKEMLFARFNEKVAHLCAKLLKRMDTRQLVLQGPMQWVGLVMPPLV